MTMEEAIWSMLAMGCIGLADFDKHTEHIKTMEGGKEEYLNIFKRFIYQFFRYYNEDVPFDNVPYDDEKFLKNFMDKYEIK